MLLRKCLIFVGIILIIRVSEISATRTRDKIYETIYGISSCFRRLNGTHQFGCASLRRGSVGVLQVVSNPDDLQWLLDKAPLKLYMAVLRPDMFVRPVLLDLKKSKKISGVVLLKRKEDVSTTISHFSHEDTCPNRYSGLSTFENPYCNDEQPWNKEGTALMEVDWGFPIFTIFNDTSIDRIVNCTSKFNAEREGQETRSLCAMEMKSFMFAAKDSETCIRRSQMMNNLNPVKLCDALGDKNVWATIIPRDKEIPEKNNSVIMLAAKLDSTSMFDGEVTGAGSTIAGLVSVLATSHMLASIRPEMEPLSKGRNVMIALLNGESHDYIGSSRLVFDMKQHNFPLEGTGVQHLNLSNIRLMIELNQVSNLNITGPNNFANIFFHPSPSDKMSPEVATFIKLMQAQGTTSKIDFLTSSVAKLPPVSLQSFVKADPQFPGVAVTDYDDHFSNKYYHSIMDDAEMLKFKYLNGTEASVNSIQAHLARLSTTLAKTIYEMTTDQPYTGSVTVDPLLIDQLLQCYLISFNCSMFRAVTKEGDALPEYSPSMYVGVANQTNLVTRLTANTLALFTGTKMTNVSKSDCKMTNKADLTYLYIWMRADAEGNDSTSVCVKSTVNYTQAVSPAFILPDYKWSSGEFSTWTESVWSEFNVRIFLKPSAGHEAFVMSLGSIVLVVSFVVIWFIASRSDILFNTNTLNGGC